MKKLVNLRNHGDNKDQFWVQFTLFHSLLSNCDVIVSGTIIIWLALSMVPHISEGFKALPYFTRVGATKVLTKVVNQNTAATH